MIYLDHAATTRPLYESHTWWHNPNSLHLPGVKVREWNQWAEEQIKDLINGHQGRVLWTANGSEANRLAITTACKGAGELVTTYLEHKSISQFTQKYGNAFNNVHLGYHQYGQPGYIHNNVKLISVQLVNNELGCITYPEATTFNSVKRQAYIHIDAVQAPGKINIDVEYLGADMLTLSAHKMYGPRGVGCLWVRNTVDLDFPYLGTPNSPAIYGFGIAASELKTHQKEVQDETAQADVLLLEKLEGYKLNRTKLLHVYGIISIRFPGVDGVELAMALEDKGLLVSTGAACNKGSRSRVLEYSGFSPQEIDETIRISLGKDSQPADMSKAAEIINKTVEEMRKNGPQPREDQRCELTPSPQG